MKREYLGQGIVSLDKQLTNTVEKKVYLNRDIFALINCVLNPTYS